jgi:glycosyltransferase involved in cell wall biosynthesis
MGPVKISVAVITFNEEKNIERCLASVRNIADEMLVLDSNSTDRTREIAEKMGARVLVNDFAGHIEQKNQAISLARFPHILSLDADEELDPELQKSILSVKENFSMDGYFMNRLTNYCGQWIYHSGWYPDKKLRLWDSRKGKWAGTNPHDRFEMEPGAQVASLSGKILHHSYNSLEEHRQQSIRFSETAAKALFLQGRKAGFSKRFLSPAFRFLYSYIFRLGFLEGIAGFHIARISAWASYLKYKRLKQFESEKPN